jgi:hypothetical protein
MKHLILIASIALSPVAAHATGGVHCMSKDEQAEISIGMGHVPIYTPFNAYAKYGDKEWSSTPQDGEMQMGDSQGLIEGEKLSVDFADEQVMDIIISLRIDTSGDEDDDDGYEGILTFEDNVPHKVYCLFE